VKTIRYINKIMRMVESTDVEKLNSKQLHQFMDELQLNIADFNAHFSETYFKVLEFSAKRHSKKAGKKIRTRKLKRASVAEAGAALV
jgi:membrane protease subunit (stomatin/prohibitin family)